MESAAVHTLAQSPQVLENVLCPLFEVVFRVVERMLNGNWTVEVGFARVLVAGKGRDASRDGGEGASHLRQCVGEWAGRRRCRIGVILAREVASRRGIVFALRRGARKRGWRRNGSVAKS